MALFNTNFNPQIDREEKLKALGLSSLLGQSAVEQPQADITVTGQPNPQPSSQPDLEVPQVPLDTLRAKPEDLQRMKPLGGLEPHKGLFGIKGTLRDVLGLVGDSFLMASGNKGIYGPGRQREKMSDALVGYGPGKEKDSIARMMQVDPEAGIAMYNDWQKRMSDQAKADVDSKRLDAQTARQDRSNQLAKMKIAAGMASLAKTPEQKLALRSWLSDPNATTEDLPDELLPGATYSTNQQVTQDYRRDKMAQDESQFTRAERGRMARDNPPAPRQPRAESSDERYIRISDKGDKATAGEKAWLTNQNNKNKKNRFGSPPPKKGGSPTSSGKMVFRNGKLVPAK